MPQESDEDELPPAPEAFDEAPAVEMEASDTAAMDFDGYANVMTKAGDTAVMDFTGDPNLMLEAPSLAPGDMPVSSEPPKEPSTADAVLATLHDTEVAASKANSVSHPSDWAACSYKAKSGKFKALAMAEYNQKDKRADLFQQFIGAGRDCRQLEVAVGRMIEKKQSASQGGTQKENIA